MKKLFLLFTTLCLSATYSIANADPAAASAPVAKQPHHEGKGNGEGPCKSLMEACKAAGFVPGGKEQGKGLFAHCLKPLMSGQTVAGVTVNPADIAACNAKHREYKKQNKHDNPNQN